MSEDRLSPRGNLFSLGGQWPESRSADRQYGANPYAQAELLKALISMQHKAREGRSDASLSVEEIELGRDLLAGAIKYIAAEYPEWRLGYYELDGDFGLAPWRGDELLVDQVDEVVNGIEQ